MDDVEQTPDEEQLRELCGRHRTSLFWASIWDGVPSDFSDNSTNARLRVFDRARMCERCRSLNGLSPLSPPATGNLVPAGSHRLETPAPGDPEAPHASVASVAPVLACGLLAAAAAATVHAAFLVRTEYDFGWTAAILGAAVGVSVRLAKSGLHRIWLQVIAVVFTFASLLLSDYIVVRYADFQSFRDDPVRLLFWGVSMLVAWQSAGPGEPEEPEVQPYQRPAADGSSVGPREADHVDTGPGERPAAVPSPRVSGEPRPTHGFGAPRVGPGQEQQPKTPTVWASAAVCLVALVATCASVVLLYQWTLAGQGLVGYSDLHVADCVRDMEPDNAVRFEVVDCASVPHTDEVYATFTLPRHDWPGESAVEELAWEGCDNAYRGYVGSTLVATNLDQSMFAPLEDDWPEDRTVVCTVSDGSAATTLGSLRSTKR